jgi:hypothetical protein
MARRRVFRVKVECPHFQPDVSITANRAALIGQNVTFENTDASVSVRLRGTYIGQLAREISGQVRRFVDRGRIVKASLEKAYPIYNATFEITGATLHLRVEYLARKGEPAIILPAEPFLAPDAEYASRSFFTKVAGVTHEGHQRIVARCSTGELLRLVRDPNNLFDSGAIKVMRLNRQQLGFVPQHVSRGGDPSGLAAQMDRGVVYSCRIKDLTGGGTKTRGVNIEITECARCSDGSLSVPVHASSPEGRAGHKSGSGYLSAAVISVLLFFALALAVMG